MASIRALHTAPLFAGPSAACALARAVDWGRTSLGPVEEWPPALRTAIRVCLQCPTAMAVWAGPEFVLIHNDGYLPVLGLKGTWAMGRPLREVWPEVLGAIEPDMCRARDEGAAVRYEEARYPLLRGGREEHAWFTYSLTPIHEEDGRYVGVFNVLEELTSSVQARTDRERRLAESEHRYRTLFESIDEGFALLEVLLGEDGRPVDLRLLEVNPGFERQSGVRDAAGRTVRELVPGVEPSWIELYAKVARTGEPRRWDAEVAALGRWFDVYAFRIGEPAEQRIAILFSDITPRKRAEEALREADRRKDQFLAVLSHELRNPLAPVKNSLYLLDRAPAGSPQARRAREVIDRQIDQLCHLVDDLLDVTRISSGKIQPQPSRLEIGGLVARTLDDHRALFERNGVALELVPAPAPIFIHADGNRIAQVIGNLLQNAAKFTPRGGRVTASIAVDPASGHAVIRVADTGAGMAPETLATLFQPFMQADATLDRSKGGLGLGLALVKGLVELHGGTVTAESPGMGRGATFTVRLPLDATAPPPVAPGPSAAPPAGRRVLVIEDNTDAADTLRDVLALEGHEVEVAYDGPTGLAAARRFHPEVVLCDIGLPVMDGYAVARAFRADESLRHIRLVALSGYAQPDDVQRGAEAGFERHLAKPPSLEKLARALGA